MKPWLKACFLAIITFITLFTVSLIMGYFIMTKSAQFSTGRSSTYPVKGKYHNPDAEAMVTHMEHIRDEFDPSIVHDLDNHEDRVFLHTHGLAVELGETAKFKAIENPSTGYTWHFDQQSC